MARINNFDNTDLDIPSANNRGLIHRDYIAHCHRWTYIQDFMKRRDKEWTGTGCVNENRRHKFADVLDVGCGKDLMLYRVLNSNKMIPRSYTGVDINKLCVPEGFTGARLKPTLLSEMEFNSLTAEQLSTRPNLVVSFEVMEHVPYEYMQGMLQNMHSLSTDNAYLIISTPCFMEKYGMAANHINEMTRDVFKQELINAGWDIVNNFGTFAGKPELYENMTKEHQRIWNELSAYYSIPVLSTLLAPLYPEFSRNNLWVCKKTGKEAQYALML